MKHSGKAAKSALTLIGLSGAAVLALVVVGFLIGWLIVPLLAGSPPHALNAAFLSKIIRDLSLNYLIWVLISLWVIFVGFTLYFFRDPEPTVPAGKNLVLAPGHGKVDTIDTTTEPEFLGGECQRISIFLSVFDVHVQNAPVTGRIAFFKHSPGQYLNAMRADSAKYNENVLIGIEAGEPLGEKIGVRLIAGLIARRIVPFIAHNEIVQRGERISLIQFGSRVEVYLPISAKIKVQLGDRVVGGESILAELA